MILTLFLIGANLNRAKLRELGLRPVHPRGGALDHPRRNLVCGDSFRLRALKQPAFPRPPLTEGGFCLPRPRSSAGSNPIAEKILPDSPGGRRIRCEFPVEPNRLLRRIEPDFHRSGTFGTPPYDSMNLFFYKTGPGPKLPATPLPGGNPQPCPGCAAPKQDGETRRWSGVIHFTNGKSTATLIRHPAAVLLPFSARHRVPG